MVDVLHWHVQPVLKSPALLLAFEGWNDAGESASSALRYVSEAIHSVPLVDIDPEEFYDFTVRRPDVVLDAQGARRIEWPSNSLRFGSVSDDRELIVGVGVEPHLRWRAFCDAFADVVTNLGVRRVVMLGAYLSDVVYSRPVTVSGYATDPTQLESIGIEGTSYQGPTGVVGVLGDRLHQAGAEIVSLWAGLPHYINLTPNPRGALALVQHLTRLLDIKVDEEPLRESTAEFENRIADLVGRDPEISEYVRQLKRREFAQ